MLSLEVYLEVCKVSKRCDRARGAQYPPGEGSTHRARDIKENGVFRRMWNFPAAPRIDQDGKTELQLTDNRKLLGLCNRGRIDFPLLSRSRFSRPSPSELRNH